MDRHRLSVETAEALEADLVLLSVRGQVVLSRKVKKAKKAQQRNRAGQALVDLDRKDLDLGNETY